MTHILECQNCGHMYVMDTNTALQFYEMARKTSKNRLVVISFNAECCENPKYRWVVESKTKLTEEDIENLRIPE